MADEDDVNILDEIITHPYAPFPSFKEWNKISVELGVVDSYSARMNNIKTTATPEALKTSMEVATKWAAVDTGAIEGLYEVDRGFTYSVAAQSIQWQNLRSLKGDEVARSIEDAMKAYEWVLDAATNRTVISEHWLKELHSVICASQETYSVSTEHGWEKRPLVKGAYKSLPNNPVNLQTREIHSYAPPLDTIPEMERLINEFRGTEFELAHPIYQSSYAHYAFVCIHPFADGNGRVSRALASVYLYRQFSIPLVIFADQKVDYFNALEQADAGFFMPFIQFISDQTVDAIGLVEANISNANYQEIALQQQTMEKILTSRGGFAYTLVDDIGIRVLEQFRTSMAAEIASNPLRPPLRVGNVGANSGGHVLIPPEFRAIKGNHGMLGISVASDPPAQAQVQKLYDVAVARMDYIGPDFVILENGRIVLELFLREIYPLLKETLKFRIETVVKRELRAMVKETMDIARSALEGGNYL